MTQVTALSVVRTFDRYDSGMRLKSHETPRSQGRNNKGKGGSARKRQMVKTFKRLTQKLKSK
jgi:hypothetical protein